MVAGVAPRLAGFGSSCFGDMHETSPPTTDTANRIKLNPDSKCMTDYGHAIATKKAPLRSLLARPSAGAKRARARQRKRCLPWIIAKNHEGLDFQAVSQRRARPKGRWDKRDTRERGACRDLHVRRSSGRTMRCCVCVLCVGYGAENLKLLLCALVATSGACSHCCCAAPSHVLCCGRTAVLRLRRIGERRPHDQVGSTTCLWRWQGNITFESPAALHSLGKYLECRPARAGCRSAVRSRIGIATGQRHVEGIRLKKHVLLGCCVFAMLAAQAVVPHDSCERS